MQYKESFVKPSLHCLSLNFKFSFKCFCKLKSYFVAFSASVNNLFISFSFTSSGFGSFFSVSDWTKFDGFGWGTGTFMSASSAFVFCLFLGFSFCFFALFTGLAFAAPFFFIFNEL